MEIGSSVYQRLCHEMRKMKYLTFFWPLYQKWFIEFRQSCWSKWAFFFWKLALTTCTVCIIVSIKMYSQGEHLIFSIIMSMSCLDNKKGKEDWLLRLKASEKKWRRNDKIIILGHTVIQKKWELSKDIIERWCRNKGNSSSF